MEAAKRNFGAIKDEAAGTLFIVQVQGNLDDSLKLRTVGRGPHLCLIALSGCRECLAQGKGERVAHLPAVQTSTRVIDPVEGTFFPARREPPMTARPRVDG